MSNKDISKTAIDEITKRGITPASRARENLSKGVFWFVCAVSLLVGMLSFSVILFFVLNDTWDLYEQLGSWFVLRSLPYFWFIALGVFIVIGKYYYRKTTLGHRQKISLIIGVYFLLTVIGGSLAYLFGIGDLIEQQLETRVPLYQHVVSTKESTWNQPALGLLAGEIVSAGPSEITLKSFSGERWIIDITNALKKGGVRVSQGEQIKMFGNVVGNNIFSAREIRPWQGRGRSQGIGGPGAMR